MLFFNFNLIFERKNKYINQIGALLSYTSDDLDYLFDPEVPTMEEELASWPKRDLVKEREELEQRYKELLENASLPSDFDFG